MKNMVLFDLDGTLWDASREILDAWNICFEEHNLHPITLSQLCENLGKPLENICMAVRDIVEKYDDVEVVYPVHLNPAVRETVFSILGDMERVHLIEPLSVTELHNTMNKSFMVMTDSGGIQEEAPALAKPVLVLRRETERPEAVAAGTVKIAGVDKEVLDACVEQVKKALPWGEVFATRAGCTVSAHCGRNTLGVLFVHKNDIV